MASDGRVIIDTELNTKGLTTGLSKLDSQIGGSLRATGAALTATAAGISAIGAGAVKTAATFDSSMSQVAATMGKTTDEMKDMKITTKDFQGNLEELAIQMGSTTKFSATEAAEALNYLALAGYDANTMAEVLPTVLNLAAAGNMDLARASDMVTDALSALGKGSDYAETMVDQMAAAASHSNTSITQLGEAILTVGGTAKDMKGGTAELSAALGVLANNGIKAAEGGTHLRNIMLALQDPRSKDAAQWFKQLGINAYDDAGNLRDLNTVFTELKNSMADMTLQEKNRAISDIFKVTDLAAVNALLKDSGESWTELQEAIENSGGAADKAAKTQMDNLNGKLELLNSAITGASIAIGHALIPYIEKVTEKIQAWVDKFNGLDDTQRQKIVKIGLAIAGVVGSFGGVLLVTGGVIKAVATISTAFSTLKNTISLVSLGIKHFGEAFSLARAGFTAFASETSVLGAAIGGLTGPVIAVIALVGVLVAAFKHLWDTNDEFRNNIIGTWENIQARFSEFFQHITDKLNELGFDFENFKEVVSTIWNELCNLLAPIFEGAWNKISILIDTVLDVISGIFDFWIDVFNGNWEGAWNDIVGIFQSIWDGIGEWFQTVFNTLLDVVNVVLEWFDTNWEKLWTGVKETAENIWTSIKEKAENIWTSIKEFFTKTIPQTIENIGTWFSELPGKIAYALGYALGSIIQWCMDTASNIAEAIPKLIEDIGTWFSELPERIKTWLDNTKEKITTWKDDIVAKAREAAKNFVDNSIENIKNFPENFKTWLDNSIDKLNKWKEDMTEKARSTGEDFKNTLIEKIKSIPEKLKSLGRDIVEGLKQGITDAWDGFTSKVSGLVDNFVGGVKDGLGIHSPSKVFKQIGMYVVEGFDEGLEGFGDNKFADISKSINATLSTARANNSQARYSVENNSNFTIELTGNMAKLFTAMIKEDNKFTTRTGNSGFRVQGA